PAGAYPPAASPAAAPARAAAGRPSAVAVGAVARRAGVSRITIYTRFGSKEALLRAIIPRPPPEGTHPPPATDPREAVRQILVEACARWASDPALYRNLPSPGASAGREVERQLVERLAAAVALRPGCSTKE